jgi:hypothetical protein
VLGKNKDTSFFFFFFNVTCYVFKLLSNMSFYPKLPINPDDKTVGILPQCHGFENTYCLYYFC